MKTVTLKKIGYSFNGIAEIKDWFSHKGTIPMKQKTYFCEEDLSEEELKEKAIENINDNGFGCMELLGAECQVCELYESGVSKIVFEFNHKF